MLSRVLILCLVALVGTAPSARADAKPKPKVYVILWFDTEDYLLPASDDAALKVADLLTKQGIRGTFKLVGHKARTLEARKRFDVIAALKKHEIGYHSDYHSVQPTPALFASNLGWDEGVEEFVRREGAGVADVERILGVSPTCYGQPGSSWCPQSYGACKKWNMVYLDAGKHVALDGKPCYYAGVFNLYQLKHYMRADINKPELLDEATAKFAAARKAILAEGGGIVSTVYHPCEWVHKQFWDGVNFSKGANPPPSQWKKPTQKTDDETKLSYRIFSDYIAFMKRFDDVEFITASQAAKLYADRARGRKFTTDELTKIAAKVGESIDYQTHGDYTLAPSEVFALLNRVVANAASGKQTPTLTLHHTSLGPTSRVVPLTEAVTTDESQLGRTAIDVDGYLTRHGRLPGAVWLGSTAVPPEAYLRAIAPIAAGLLAGKPIPPKVEVKPATLETTKYVSKDDPKLWGWVIFPPGFAAPAMMDLAKRQAWTLKPALLGAAK